MKYFGAPGSVVIDYDKLKTVFKFDEKGEFETEDEKLIKWMGKHKGFIRREETAVKPKRRMPERDREAPNDI